MAATKRKAEEQPANNPAAKKLNPKVKPTEKAKKMPKADSPVKTRQRTRSARGLESDQWAGNKQQGRKPSSPSKENRQKVVRTQRAEAFAFHEQDPPPAPSKPSKPKTFATAAAAAPKTFAAAAAAAVKTLATTTMTRPGLAVAGASASSARPAAGVSGAAAPTRPTSAVARPVSTVASASAVTSATVAAARSTAAAATRPNAAATVTAARPAITVAKPAATAPRPAATATAAVASATAAIARPTTSIPVIHPTFPAHVYSSTPAHHRATFRPRSHQKLPMDVAVHTYPPAQFGSSANGPPAGFKRLPLQETTNAPAGSESCHVRHHIPTKLVGQTDSPEEEWEVEDDPLADQEADEEMDIQDGNEDMDIQDGDEEDAGSAQDLERTPLQAPGRRQVTGPKPRDYFDDEDMGDAGDAYQPELQEPESEHESEAGLGSGEELEEIEIDAPLKQRRTRKSRKRLEEEDEVEGEAERRAAVRLAYIRVRCYTATRNPFPSPEEEHEMIDKAWKWVQRHREEYADLELLPMERPVIHVFITNIRGKIKASARKKVEAAYPWSHRSSENIQLYNQLMENDAYTHKDPDALTGRWLNRLLFSIIQDIFFCGKNADGLKQKKLFTPISLELIAL
ncbi:hypothetical protein FRC01_005730, partial [Tulasnella sp. 417]